MLVGSLTIWPFKRRARKPQVPVPTQSAGSTEFPFKSLWSSSLFLPSLSLTLMGSNSRDVPAVRSGSSAKEVEFALVSLKQGQKQSYFLMRQWLKFWADLAISCRWRIPPSSLCTCGAIPWFLSPLKSGPNEIIKISHQKKGKRTMQPPHRRYSVSEMLWSADSELQQ